MNRYLRTAMALMLGGMLLAATAQADERQANELRERANALKEKVQRLHNDGKHDEAQQVEREVAQLFEKADRVAGEGPREPGAGEAVAEKLRVLYKEWMEATINERQDMAEELQRKIHDISRDAGARMQELLKPQLEMMERRIAELREQGKMELADRLTGQLREMIQAHRRAQVQQSRDRVEGPPGIDDIRQRISELERRHGELREQGNPQQAEEVARELERFRDLARRTEENMRERQQREQGPDGRRGPGPQDRGEMERRMQHLRVAADNLNAIGMQDLAQRLCNEANEIQRALENPPPPGNQGPRDGMEDLRNEVRKLDERINDLHRRLDELSEMLRRERQ